MSEQPVGCTLTTRQIAMKPTSPPVAHGTVPLLAAAALLALSAVAVPAAPNRRQPAAPAPPPPAAETAAPAAPQKKGFFQRLRAGFRRKAPPPPAPQPAPQAQKRSSRGSPSSGRSLANARTLKPEPPDRSGAKPARDPQPAPAPAAPPSPASEPAGIAGADDEPPRKKRSFFARLFGGRAEPEAPAEVPAEFRIERPDDWQSRWIVTDDNVALYEYGPSQAGAPNARLPRGTVVKVAGLTSGWTRIELENGQTGFIGSDQLRRAVAGDFTDPPPRGQLAVRGGPPPSAWEPAPPPPDLPSMPANPDMEAALLLLPPLESDSGSPGAEPPELLPGDPFPPLPGDPPQPGGDSLEDPEKPPADTGSEAPAGSPEPAEPSPPPEPPAPPPSED